MKRPRVILGRPQSLPLYFFICNVPSQTGLEEDHVFSFGNSDRNMTRVNEKGMWSLWSNIICLSESLFSLEVALSSFSDNQESEAKVSL